jgi:DNA-binding FadR family transcriptional regulator
VDRHTDMSFHAALAAASKNPLGEAVWQMISIRVGEVLERNAAVPNVYPNTLRDHEAIFAAVKARNPRRAREAMRKHLANAHRVSRLASYKSGLQASVGAAIAAGVSRMRRSRRREVRS